MHEVSNDNGERLIDFAASLNMTIVSTYFEYKNIHKATSTSPNGGAQNQINHILIDLRHGNNVIDCRSCRGANMDSDHFLIGAILRIRISNTKEENKGLSKKKYDMQKLQNEKNKKRV